MKGKKKGASPGSSALLNGEFGDGARIESSYRNDMIDTYLGRTFLDPSAVTLAEIAGRGGYVARIFGEWRLGD